VRAHNLQRHSLAVGGQPELLALRLDQSLRLHAADEGNTGPGGESQRAAERSNRRPASPVLLFEQVFKGVFELAPLPGRTGAGPPEEEGGHSQRG